MAENTHETKIVIGGDDSGAIGLLSSVSKHLDGVFRSVANLTKYLARLNWAIHAVTTVIEGIKKLHEWTNRAATAAKALREELAKSSYENAVARAADAYKKLNKNLEETLRLEKERSAILAARKATERDIEDANAERAKQIEISELDPNAKDYADRKKEIERRYEVSASNTKAARAGEDTRADAKSLYDQAASKDREAALLEKEWNRANAITETAVERRWKAGMEARSGDETAKARAKEAEEAFKKAFDFAAKIKEEMEKARKEAESLRRQAAEKAGGNLAATIRNEAEKRKIENDAKADAAEKRRKDDEDAKRESEKNAKEQKTRDQNLEDAKLKRLKEEDLAALNPADPDYEKKKREIEYTYEMRAAEDKVKRADNKTDREAAEEEAKAISIRYNSEKRNAAIGQGMEVAERAASFDGVSQNRLTAMGLGSGVSASGGVASDVKKLVDLLKQEVEESKKLNEKDYSSGSAYYAE